MLGVGVTGEAAARALALKYLTESIYGAQPVGVPVWKALGIEPLQGSVTIGFPEPPKPRLDPRKVVVGGRYLRPGDELLVWDGRARVTRVEEGRMTLEITVPVGGDSPLARRGTIALTDQDCVALQKDVDRGDVRRAGGPNVEAAA